MHEEHSYVSQESFMASRLYNKLLPKINNNQGTEDIKSDNEDEEKLDHVTTVQKKRGRRSKDEQLAWENGLPANAEEITRMSHSAIQQLMRESSLTTPQKQLIKKIRRRGMIFI